MIEKQKTTFMRLGLGLAGVVVDDETAEKIWRIYEELNFKKGDFAMRDVIKIESEITVKYKKRNARKELRESDTANEVEFRKSGNY
jgi:hypothetical protein